VVEVVVAKEEEVAEAKEEITLASCLW